MTKLSLLVFLSLICRTAVSDSQVAVEKLSDKEFQLKFSSTEVLDPARAQKLLLPTAQTLCDGSSPQFGHYSFESSEAIGDQRSQDSEAKLVFIQDVECVANNPTPKATPTPLISTPEQRAAIEAEIKTLSYTYFVEILGGNYKDAYARLAESLKSFRTYEEWTAQMDGFRDDVGDIGELNIHTITVYDNPPNSQEPGLYVAADYQNKFTRAPYHCGYLIWFRSQDDQFEIIREESGWVTNQILLQIPSEQLPGLLARFRCVTR